MPILTLDDVTKGYGVKPLLEGVSIGLEAGEKLGVIGQNGSGKTTLLRLVAGAEAPDSGRVVVPDGVVVGYLPQRPPLDPASTVLDAVFSGSHPDARLLRDYEAAVAALDARPDDAAALQRLTELSHKLDVSGGWDLEANARAVLGQLGIADTEARVGTLSGGQKKRVALAGALVLRPDLLILDEPTNHLDADTIAWLEGYLAAYTGALLLVTHDRYVLDRVVDQMWEVARGGVRRYTGGYTRYLEQKDAEAEREAAEEATRANLARRELAWLRRGAKARTSKSKSRIRRAHALLDAAPTEREERLEITSASQRLGTKVVELEGVTKGWDGAPLFEDVTLRVQRGDRVGIIGPNGAGKTTLLHLVGGQIQPDEGTVAHGPTVKVGLFDQEGESLKDDLLLIEAVEEIADTVKTADGSLVTASKMLERFLFPVKQQRTPVGLLSGGERRRLHLLRVLMGAPNVLLLDEPTNDLDITTLVALEDYLDAFAGALVVVSHDRYLLDRTAERTLRVADGAVREFAGGYSDALAVREREQAEADAAEAARAARHAEAQRAQAEAAAAAAPPPAAKKLTYGEKLELAELEERIAASEARQTALADELTEHASDYGRVAELSAEAATLAERLDADVERWAELAERA